MTTIKLNNKEVSLEAIKAILTEEQITEAQLKMSMPQETPAEPIAPAEKVKINKVVYHGSPNPNIKFDFTDNRVAFFTDNKDLAGDFANAKDRGGIMKGEISTIYEKNINLENPYIITTDSEYEDLMMDISSEDVERLKKDGYDGVAFLPKNEEEGDSNYYAVFSDKSFVEPEVKSEKKDVIIKEKKKYANKSTKTNSKVKNIERRVNEAVSNNEDNKGIQRLHNI